jgi:uncharacterized membrane protein
MEIKGIFYLLVTFGLFLVFALIVVRTMRSRNRDRLEEARHRMLEDD